jgi:hypothetical protein
MESKTKEKYCWATRIYIYIYFTPVTKAMSQFGVESEHKHTSIPLINNFFHVVNFNHYEIKHAGSTGKADGSCGKCQVRSLAATLYFMRDSCRNISQISQENDRIGPESRFTFLLKSFQLTNVIYI